MTYNMEKTAMYIIDQLAPDTKYVPAHYAKALEKNAFALDYLKDAVSKGGKSVKDLGHNFAATAGAVGDDGKVLLTEPDILQLLKYISGKSVRGLGEAVESNPAAALTGMGGLAAGGVIGHKLGKNSGDSYYKEANAAADLAGTITGHGAAGAAIGAGLGGLTGAFKKDDKGKRHVITGALGGAVKGGLVGGTVGAGLGAVNKYSPEALSHVGRAVKDQGGKLWDQAKGQGGKLWEQAQGLGAPAANPSAAAAATGAAAATTGASAGSLQ